MKIKFRLIPNPEACFGGVCAGIAYLVQIEVWIIRLLMFLALVVEPVIIFLFYILVWVFVPQMETVPSDYEKICK